MLSIELILNHMIFRFFSDIRRHFISFGKVRKEICINLPTSKILLDDGYTRQKTRKTN